MVIKSGVESVKSALNGFHKGDELRVMKRDRLKESGVKI